MFHLSTSYIASNSPHFSWVEEEENNKMALGGANWMFYWDWGSFFYLSIKATISISITQRCSPSLPHHHIVPACCLALDPRESFWECAWNEINNYQRAAHEFIVKLQLLNRFFSRHLPALCDVDHLVGGGSVLWRWGLNTSKCCEEAPRSILLHPVSSL